MMLGIQDFIENPLLQLDLPVVVASIARQYPDCRDQTLVKKLIDKTISQGTLKDGSCSAPARSSKEELDSEQTNHSNKNDAQNAPVESSKKDGSQKAKETLNVFATAVLPIAGALGTLSVFLIANFYVGDVEVSPAIPFHTLEVHAYNNKGQEAIFHTPRFQLMPDNYHFEITVDSAVKQHADAAVQFRQKTLVQVSQPASPQSLTTITDTVKKKHWWQLWKKTQDKKNSTPENQAINQPEYQLENQTVPKAKHD
jgi:hypothetical protein